MKVKGEVVLEWDLNSEETRKVVVASLLDSFKYALEKKDAKCLKRAAMYYMLPYEIEEEFGRKAMEKFYND